MNFGCLNFVKIMYLQVFLKFIYETFIKNFYLFANNY